MLLYFRLEGSVRKDGGGDKDHNIDRLASEVNILNFLVAQCEGASVLEDFRPVNILTLRKKF